MSDHSIQDMQKQVKVYLTIFGMLIVLVGVAFGISHLDLRTPVRICLILGIALLQAILSTAYFMHLNAEKKIVYFVLLLTAVFLAVMVFITLWTFHDSTAGHVS